jgi:hypothetical protein
MKTRIVRTNGLPESRYCRMTPEGVIEIRDEPRAWPYVVPAWELNSMEGFVRWVCQLGDKMWVTPEVMADFTVFVSLLKNGAPGEWAAWVQSSR